MHSLFAALLLATTTNVTYRTVDNQYSKFYRIGNKHLLQEDAARAFLQMREDALKEGVELNINSSFRTFKQQEILFGLLGAEIAARPGTSNHESGIAVDIAKTERYIPRKKLLPHYKAYYEKWCNTFHKGMRCPTATYWWLHKNAERYGFKQTVSHEKWHWEFQGTFNCFKVKPTDDILSLELVCYQE